MYAVFIWRGYVITVICYLYECVWVCALCDCVCVCVWQHCQTSFLGEIVKKCEAEWSLCCKFRIISGLWGRHCIDDTPVPHLGSEEVPALWILRLLLTADLLGIWSKYGVNLIWCNILWFLKTRRRDASIEEMTASPRPQTRSQTKDIMSSCFQHGKYYQIVIQIDMNK